MSTTTPTPRRSARLTARAVSSTAFPELDAPFAELDSTFDLLEYTHPSAPVILFMREIMSIILAAILMYLFVSLFI
jgi:hypothetical protein